MKIIDNPERLNKFSAQYRLNEIFQDLDRYRPYLHLVTFEKNEIVSGKVGQQEYLFFFLRGKLQVCADLSNGKSLLVCFYTSFQMLGDLEFFGIDTSDTTTRAVVPCTFLTLCVTEIRRQLNRDPVFLRYMAKSLAQKLAAVAHNSSINQLYPLENKLASYIIQLQYAGLFLENLTHMADLLGTSYRHLLRTIRAFVDEGILAHTEIGYRILDRSRLEDLAQDLYLT